jgi:DNA modification methylase
MISEPLKTRHEIVYRKVDDLVPYANNARLHSKAQVKELAAIIAEFGFNVPILLEPDGTIVAGHGRVMAAKQLGLVDVPTINLGTLSPEQRRAYRLADNAIALKSTWDESVLKRELEALQKSAFDLAMTGLDESHVEKLLRDVTVTAKGRGADPDATPAPSTCIVSQPGDLWRMGGHRLLCGDSTAAADVSRVLAGERPNLMVTDPPYGVKYRAAWRNEAHATATMNRSFGATTDAIGVVANDDNADWRQAWRLFPGHVAYVWHAHMFSDVVFGSLSACGFKIRAAIVMVKKAPVISRGHYHWQHEPCVYAVQEGRDDDWRFVPEHEVAAYAVLEGKTADWHGGRKQSTVWEIEHVKSETGHSTQKPVECMRRPIVNNSSRGDAVYEPFSGSGTTIIAAEMTGRRCLAIELNPAYVDIAVRRWQDFTGGIATLDGGASFDVVAASRAEAAAA